MGLGREPRNIPHESGVQDAVCSGTVYSMGEVCLFAGPSPSAPGLPRFIPRTGFFVRSLLNVVVMVAVVIHFACGCCLHAAPFCADDRACCAEHDDAPAGDAHHAYSGCSCVATVDADPIDPISLLHSPSLSAVAWCVMEPLPAGADSLVRPKDRGGPPQLDASHPLHERLLV